MGALVRRVDRQSESLARAMVAEVAAKVDAFRRLPDDLLQGRVLDACRYNLRLFVETVDTGELPADDAFAPLRALAAERAADGTPLDDVLAAYHVGARVGWDALRAAARPTETGELLDAAALVLVYVDAVSRAVSDAYVSERLHGAAAAQAAEWALLDAFLAGRPTVDAAARAGRLLASSYAVLLLQMPVARDHLRAFEGAIVELFGRDALWRLTAQGANVLVPVEPARRDEWLEEADRLVSALGAAAGAGVVGAVAWGAGPDGVAGAGDEAVQVLRLVGGLGRSPGLYRLDDVLLEAALSNIAAAPSARLTAILAPLDAAGGRELLGTLEAYVLHDADRRRTAAALHVHPNTLDYRLRRIAELTGRSPATARGLQVLGAALTLRRVGGIR